MIGALYVAKWKSFNNCDKEAIVRVLHISYMTNSVNMYEEKYYHCIIVKSISGIGSLGLIEGDYMSFVGHQLAPYAEPIDILKEML